MRRRSHTSLPKIPRAWNKIDRSGHTQDSQERTGLSVSSQRKSLGRKLLSENAERQTEEIQRLRQDKRRMRANACRNDSRKEGGDRKRKGENGVNEVRADQRSALNI